MSKRLAYAAGLLAALVVLDALLVAAHAEPGPILGTLLAALLLLPVVLALVYAELLARKLGARPALAGGVAAAVATLALAYALGVAVLDRALAAQDHGAAYDGCRKVWATRGLVAPALAKVASAGNTPATVNAAFAHGAPGVEVDVYYDPALADFVVSHDFPYELKDGALLMLDALLAQTDPSKHYWLDFKRHGRLTRAQAEAAAVRLAAIADARRVGRRRLWIEGTEPLNLMPFVHAGFSVIFDVHPPRDDHWLTPLAAQLHKAVFLWGGYTVMGMNYGTAEHPIYGPVERRLLGDIPVFLYHVPTDRALLAQVARIPQVRVLMAGDHSANVYDIDACAVR